MAGVSVDQIRSLLENSKFEVLQEEALPRRDPAFSAVNPTLHPQLRKYLESTLPSDLYSHQAQGIHAFLSGKDVCLATSTASGKSMVFMAAAAHLCLSDPEACVLALYPAKALIQDQLLKWRTLCEAVSLSVAFIDGSVPTASRSVIIETNQVVLMTPDVAHAWLMSHLGENEPARFLRRLKLLVLDELHVYEGVFGTNMAYFLRRLQCVANRFQIISSTATLADESEFVRQLSGRDAVVLDESADGGGAPNKSLLLIEGKNFDSLVTLLRALIQQQESRFLAFADSRKMVERIVAAVRRDPAATTAADDSGEGEDVDEPAGIPGEHRVFPYRAGYENEDRLAIQRALSSGGLRGVVATGALELGLDIGEIDLVILLSVPRSVKAFRQRIGRAGRKNDAVAIIVDSRATMTTRKDGLRDYLSKPAEPNWLYLPNRFLQYANALCAAVELAGSNRDLHALTPLASLPTGFIDLLENELRPSQMVPDDLYSLKQRAMGGPHREFPIRSDMEQNFEISGPMSQGMGEITHSQSLREAYPGAVYYYMAKPYRVKAYKYRDGEIIVQREKAYTTEPTGQTMVFPKFQNTHMFLKNQEGFLTECSLQVSERVTGFTELRGNVRESHAYGVGSPWYQKELSRFFQTTGICWSVNTPNLSGLPIATVLVEAFSQEFGVHPRDLGVGTFYAQVSPILPGECRGACVYDATNGSLRLTTRLIENFGDVIGVAIDNALAREDASTVSGLESLRRWALDLSTHDLAGSMPIDQSDGDWQVVIAPEQHAMCGSGTALQEVEVEGYRYTPQGIYYDLVPLDPKVEKYSAPARSVQPINGVSKLLRVNFVTNQTQDI